MENVLLFGSLLSPEVSELLRDSVGIEGHFADEFGIDWQDIYEYLREIQGMW